MYEDLMTRIENGENIQGLGRLGSAVPKITSQQLDAWISDAMTNYALTKNAPKTFGVEAVPITFFHRIDYPVAGFTAPTNFFQAAVAEFVTNFDGAAGLAPNYGFILDSLGVDVERGVTAAGVHAATPTNTTTVIADVDNAVISGEAIRRILDGGRLKFSVGSKEYIDMYGLKHFSCGNGIEVSGFASDSTTAGAAQRRIVQHVNNGSAFSANKGYQFPRGIPILPGDRPKVALSFQSAIPIPIASVIRCQMTGVLFRFA